MQDPAYPLKTHRAHDSNIQIAMILMENANSIIFYCRAEGERVADMTIAECSHMQAPEIKHQGVLYIF